MTIGAHKKTLMSSKVWMQMRSKQLSDTAQRVYLYCLCNEECKPIGCYKLPVHIIQEYAFGSSKPSYEAVKLALQELADKAMLTYDFQAECVAVRDWFTHSKTDYVRDSDILHTKELVHPDSPVFQTLLMLINRVLADRKQAQTKRHFTASRSDKNAPKIRA